MYKAKTSLHSNKKTATALSSMKLNSWFNYRHSVDSMLQYKPHNGDFPSTAAFAKPTSTRTTSRHFEETQNKYNKIYGMLLFHRL